ncbi:MAG: hemolysin family protein [Rhodobacterales bacterium]
MGDSIDGSRGAAHGALPYQQTETPVSGGLLRRIIGVLTPSDSTSPSEECAPTQAAAAHKQVHDILNLRQMRVEDVAIPKADITAVPDTIPLDELVELFRETGLTRLPVYSGTLDTPLGMLHLKDFALKHGFNRHDSEFSLKQMLRPLLYVPPSMSIGVLLQKMQSERKHMALVIDEYGGVDGLLTIEDLIEQVIGEIEDEHDTDEDQFWTLEKPGQYLVLSKTPLDAFEAEIGLSLTDHEDVDEEEIDTLGGLVFMLAGRVPVRGEVVQHPAGVEFEVVDADPRRIKRLRVRLPHASAN